MDLILALKFISAQYLTGVFDGETYYQRVIDTLEEAASEKDADTHMKQFAKFINK